MSADGKLCKMLLEYKEKYPVVSAYWNRFYAVSSQTVGIACPATDRYLHYDCKADSVSMELQINSRQHTTFQSVAVQSSLSPLQPGLQSYPI